MARERGSSVLNVYSEYSSILGPKTPDEIKKMIPRLDKVDDTVIEKLLEGAVLDIKGTPADADYFFNLSNEDIPQETIMILYSGLLATLKAAFRPPVGSLKKDSVKRELLDLKFPQSIVEKIIALLFSESSQELEDSLVNDRIKLPSLAQLRWRLDVGISSSVLTRVLEPTILMEMKTDSGEKHTFEVSQSAFHDLRYNVADVLKEMEDLERRNILKIQT